MEIQSSVTTGFEGSWSRQSLSSTAIYLSSWAISTGPSHRSWQAIASSPAKMIQHRPWFLAKKSIHRSTTSVLCRKTGDRRHRNAGRNQIGRAPYCRRQQTCQILPRRGAQTPIRGRLTAPQKSGKAPVMTFCRKFWTLMICVGLSFSLTGCASILSKRKYEVTMNNTGGPTYFSVHDHKNNLVQSGVTPQQVTLKSNAAPFRPAKYHVVYAGTDGVQRHDLNAQIDWWTAGNIVIGGVPGVVIDAGTGALWKLPPEVTGYVPAEKIVSNSTQGATVLASYSQSSASGGPGARTPPSNVQPAMHGQREVQAQYPPFQ